MNEQEKDNLIASLTKERDEALNAEDIAQKLLRSQQQRNNEAIKLLDQAEIEHNTLLASDKMLRDALENIKDRATVLRRNLSSNIHLWKEYQDFADACDKAKLALSTPPPVAYSQLVAKIQEPLVKDKEEAQ